MSNIILASSSPYRKALLDRLGIEFNCFAPEVDEDSFKTRIKDPQELAETLAFEKAKKGLERFPNSIVIGSDQLMVFKGENFGKPGSFEKAFEQLRKLSGEKHQLITSYCVITNEIQHIETNITTLKMRPLNEYAIKNYLISDNPIDCAGAYKLELNGIALFEEIQTDDHTAIVGLPLLSLGNFLNKIGIAVPPNRNNEKGES